MFGEWPTRTCLKLKAVIKRRQLEQDLEEELQFHLAMREEKERTAGVAALTARDSAHRQFGNSTSLKERCREMWTFVSLESLWQDIRYGLRILRANSALYNCRHSLTRAWYRRKYGHLQPDRRDSPPRSSGA